MNRTSTRLMIFAMFAVSRPATAQTLTSLFSFSGAQGSGSTQGPLVQGPDGLFYGAIQTGGTQHDGAIFKITPGGSLTTLYSFSGSDGKYPSSGVALGPDGNFYGTTYIGGTNPAPGYAYSNGVNGAGTIFKITPTGTFTVLHYFNGVDGERPFTGLTLGSDGNFYGVANGGTYGLGTFYRISPTGTFSSLLSFSSGKPGPDSRLILGSDGNLYGTAEYESGTTLGGILSRITPGGALSTVYSANGWFPNGPLTIRPDGSFYGTTASGGSSGTSTIFKVTQAGVLTTLYSGTFGPLSGSPNLTGFFPAGALTLGPDGNFYGMTSVGGASSDGSIFRVTTAGALSTLYSFSGKDGEYPNSGLTLGSDGNFYGIASAGGTFNEGTIFSLNVGGFLPSITANGVVNAATYSGPVAPGSIAAVFGAFLLPTPISSTAFPLPTSISGLSLQFGTLPAAPLFFGSQSQFNLQIPWELAGQTQTTASISKSGQVSTTQTVTLSTYGPGIFVVNGQTGQGAVLDASYNLVGLGNPTTAGADVLIYCTGLGPVTNQPATGAPGLANPLSWTTTTPIVTVGGVSALVLFSGLVPDDVGLYQMNVQVPTAATKGSSVPLTVSIGGVQSNTVFLAIQ